MSSSPAIDVPTELVQRYHALQATRSSRAAGRCDCQCRRCSNRASARPVPPASGTSIAT